MIIFVKKFGITLVSRPAGKEAFLAFQPVMKDIFEKETIEIDFDGVNVLTPSWADEFLRPMMEKYPGRIVLKNITNPSVKATLEILKYV